MDEIPICLLVNYEHELRYSHRFVPQQIQIDTWLDPIFESWPWFLQCGHPIQEQPESESVEYALVSEMISSLSPFLEEC